MKKGSFMGVAATTALLAAAGPLFAEGPTLRLEIAPGSECVRPDGQIEVEVRLTDIPADSDGAAGYQAFVEFNNNKLNFVHGNYDKSCFALPLLDIQEDPKGVIGLAAGIDVFKGQDPIYDDCTLAVLTFVPKEENCAVNVDFCTDCKQENIVSDPSAEPLPDLKLMKSDDAVVDGTPPRFQECCEPVKLDADANCQAFVPLFECAAKDNCEEPLSYSQFPAAGTKLGLGTTTVTIIAEDCAGNTTTCQTDVTVNDVTPPVINVCPPDRTLKLDNECSTRVPDLLGQVEAKDNCDNPSLITYFQDPPADTELFGQGKVTVTITAKDNFGNFSEPCEVSLTLRDSDPPKIAVCPNDHQLKLDADCQATLPDFTGNIVAVDNCTKQPNLLIEQDPPGGTVLNGQGVTMVTITVTDMKDQIDTCTFPVERIDNTAPEIQSCGKPVTLELDKNCQAEMPDLTSMVSAFDNCDMDLEITQSKPAGSKLLGQGTIWVDIFVSDDKNNTSTCRISVTTVDAMPPQIMQCSNVVKMKVDEGCDIKVPQMTGGVVAVDNCADELTITQDPPAGTIVEDKMDVDVTITVTDEKGNYSTCTTQIQVSDNEPPVIFCPDNIVAECTGDNGAVVPFDVSAVDNCDDEPEIRCFIVNEKDEEVEEITNFAAYKFPNKSRTFVRCRATDNQGNSQSCMFTVTVQDSTPPEIECPGEMTLKADEYCKGLLGQIEPVSVTDNCDLDPVVFQQPPAGTQFNGQGQYLVTLFAEDNSGNQSSCKVQITVVDNDPPEVTFPNGLKLKVDSRCEVQIPDLRPGVKAWDNCAKELLIEQDPAPKTRIPLADIAADDLAEGLVEVEITVTDEKGNYTTGVVPIAVNDQTPPKVYNCPADFTLKVGTDQACNAMVQPLEPEKFDDNCTDEPAAMETEVFDAEGKSIGFAPVKVFLGSYTAVTRVFDKAGNYDSCETAIEVIDNEPPAITCPPDQTLKAMLTMCVADTDPGEATAKDNCEVVKVSATRSDDLKLDEPYPLGDTLITWKALDSSDNQSTCVQTITVIDNEPPLISCPPNIDVNADPGECTAKLNPGEASARDNCDDNVQLTAERSDGLDLKDLYTGTVTITWTAEDDAGNTATCEQIVNVDPYNTLIVDLELSKNVDNGPFDRCIRFELFECPMGEPTAVLEEVITFTNGEARNVQLKAPCGVYSCITATDELHTLRRTAKDLSLVDKKFYEADFTGDMALILGNLNNDAIIDILDWAIFASQFLAMPGPDTDCETPAPHADLSGNGIVFVEDHSFIAANFRRQADQNCCVHEQGGNIAAANEPITSISVEELSRMGLAHLAVADLNGDGVVDSDDMDALGKGVEPVPARTYAGQDGGSWFEAGNWSGNVRPEANTDVSLDKGVVVDRDGAAARTVQVENGGSLMITTGSLSAGAVTIDAGASLQLDDAMALLQVDALTLMEGANLDWSAGTIELGGLFTSAEALVLGVEGETTLSLLEGSEVDAPSMFVGMLGNVQGNGVVMGDLTNDGLLQPELLSVTGSYTQTAAGHLAVALGDQLQVTGEATLDGALAISLGEGAALQRGDRFEVVSAGLVNGQFSKVDLPELSGDLRLRVSYEADGVVIKVVAAEKATTKLRR